MHRFITFLLALLAGLSAVSAQSPAHLKALAPPADFENIHVHRLAGDSLSSQFVIWIKKGVAAHYHAAHSESVLILAGQGLMQLGDDRFKVKKGDCVFIPKGTPHAVSTTRGTLKVLSIQAPHFDGSDRILLNP